METLFPIIGALQPQEWITKIKLKDAYHHILVHVNIRKYFCFVIAGKTYQFHVLPFGLSTALWEFTLEELNASGSAASYPRDKSSCIPRQLDHPGRFTRTESLTYLTNHPTLTNFGMDYQLEEVYARTPMHSRLLRTAFQSPTSHSFSSRLILRFSPRCPIPSINIHGHACTQDILHHQSDLALCPLYPSRTPPSQVPAVLDKETLVTAQAVMGHSDPTGCRISHSTLLIQQTRSSPRSPSASPGTQPVFLHRCISNRMGSQLAESSSLRTVVTPRILSGHQLVGARGHQIGCTSMGTSVAQSDCTGVLRQQHSSSLHSQTGRDPFHISVQQTSGTISSSGPVCDSSHSNPTSRNQECDRQQMHCLESTAPVLQNGGFLRKPYEICLRTSLFPSPQVRHGREQSVSSLCITLPERQSLGGRRPLHILGQLRPSVHLPSSSHSSQNPPEDQGLRQHHGDSHCFPTPVSAVALAATTTQPSSSHTADRRSTVSIHLQHLPPPVPQRASPVRSSRVALIRDILKQHNFPDTVVDMAANPLPDFSSNVYNSQWKAFAKWANYKGIQSKDLSYVMLAEYLVLLLMENKQVNTIKVHRASIANVLKILNLPTALQEDTIHNIIHRMSILLRLTQEVLSRWHLSVVL